MIRQIEIYPKIKNYEINKRHVQSLIDYLDKKYQGWSEFNMTNKTDIRLLIFNSKVLFLEKTASIGKLIELFRKLNPAWERYTINTKDFKTIESSELKTGMLFRYAQKLDNLYNLVLETSSIDAICISSDNSGTWVFNFDNQKDYKQKIIIESVDNFEEVKEYFISLNKSKNDKLDSISSK